MKVNSVLRSKGSDVQTVRPEEPIQTVIRKFKDKGIGALVVSNNYAEIQGMISERDIVLGLAEHGVDFLSMTVAEVMQNGAVCAPDDDLIVVMSRIFNRITYHVSLARGFSGFWREIRSGHLFDIGSRSISDLVGTSLIVPRLYI